MTRVLQMLKESRNLARRILQIQLNTQFLHMLQESPPPIAFNRVLQSIIEVLQVQLTMSFEVNTRLESIIELI